LRKQRFLNQFAKNVSSQDVHFLNTRVLIAKNADAVIDRAVSAYGSGSTTCKHDAESVLRTTAAPNRGFLTMQGVFCPSATRRLWPVVKDQTQDSQGLVLTRSFMH
jgi:hypothetical protein